MRTVTRHTRPSFGRTVIFTLAAFVIGITAHELNGFGFGYLDRPLAENLPPLQGPASERGLAAGQQRESIAGNAQSPTDPWTADLIIEPEQLAKAVSDPHGHKILVLNVGPAALYKRGHITNSKYIGQASQAGGLKSLTDAVQGFDRDQEIVLYCGCCPWNVCPNIRPAFKALQELGFKKVRVLHLPNDFRRDWVNKGFPVQTGES